MSKKLFIELCILFFIGSNIYGQTFFYQDAMYLGRQETFDSLPLKKRPIVFAGNSLTQYFELEIFNNKKIINRGISGDETNGLLNRIHGITRQNPQKVFLEIGINDIGNNVQQEVLLNNYSRIVDSIIINCKKAKIFIQSILPVSNHGNPGYCNENVNNTIKEVNIKLAKLADEKKCVFIDLYKEFVKDGQMNKDYTIDGIHLNYKGYLTWTTTLRPYLK
jgi:lysophospholipase L1-like esterase